MMSNFSTTTIAAHQAAMNFASLLYMTSLSLAMAMTISVGFEVGAKRYNNAKTIWIYRDWLSTCIRPIIFHSFFSL